MAFISAAVAGLGALGAAAASSPALLGLGLVGSAAGAAGQAYYTSQASAASRRAERARQEQMRLESMRRMREQMRQAQNANAMSLSRSVGQGAGVAGSNLAGAYGQTQGALGRASNAEYQNLQIGERIFQANLDQSTAQGWASTFNGLGNFSNNFLQSQAGLRQIFAPTPGSTQQSTNYPQASNPWFSGGVGAQPY